MYGLLIAAATFFVSPTGDDASAGSFESPFRSPRRARDAVRALRRKDGLPEGGVKVYLRGGMYPVAETLKLGAGDSGEPGRPVVWSAYPGETPVFDGSFEVPPVVAITNAGVLARLPDAAREHVRCVDLRAAGYEVPETSPVCGRDASSRGNGAPCADLYEDGRRLTLAEEPNGGWFRHFGGHSSNMTVRTELDGGDWTRWMREPDLMVKGYTTWCWTLLTAKVVDLDPAAKMFAFGGDLDFTHQYKGHFIDNQAFKFVNALCALDRPGEWYFDKRAGVLYVWPTGGRLTMSRFPSWFLRIDEAHDIRVEGMVFQYGCGEGLASWKSHDIVFEGNVVRNFGKSGFWTECVSNFVVRGCVFHTFGQRALAMTGGDHGSLTYSGNRVEGNDFSDAANRVRCPLLQLGTRGRTDCGTTVAGNVFHDTWGSAICACAGELLVTNNVIERCVLREEDEGAFDIGGDPTFLGVKIVDNTWRDIGCDRPDAPRRGKDLVCGQAAVRLDDAISMVLVKGNRFINCGSGKFGGVQINSGRRNVIVDNIFERCNRKISGRDSPYPKPLGAWRHAWNPEKEWSAKFRARILSEPYRKRYPGVETLPDAPYEYIDERNLEVE